MIMIFDMLGGWSVYVFVWQYLTFLFAQRKMKVESLGTSFINILWLWFTQKIYCCFLAEPANLQWFAGVAAPLIIIGAYFSKNVCNADPFVDVRSFFALYSKQKCWSSWEGNNKYSKTRTFQFWKRCPHNISQHLPMSTCVCLETRLVLSKKPKERGWCCWNGTWVFTPWVEFGLQGSSSGEIL